MFRTFIHSSFVISALSLAGIASAGSPIYRCVDAQGLKYQDSPCAGATTQQRVAVPSEYLETPGATASRRNSDVAFKRWLARTEQENRRRDAENRLNARIKEHRQIEAEFAQMEEDLESQRGNGLEAGAPLAYEIDAREAQARQQYAQELQRKKLEIRSARQALDEER